MEDVLNDDFFTNHSANIIYRHEHTTLISKKPYSCWEEIQDEFEDYQTNLNYTYADIIDFLIEDYGIDEDEQQQIVEFFKSDYTVFEWGIPNKTY